MFEIEYVVQYGQCPDCTRLAAKNTWKAQVQVRQKVPHKRTFLYLEQLILKHNAHKDTININEKKDGLDFYYTQRSHAVKMCEFLASVVPVRVTASSSVISMDIHSSTSNNKFTYSVEIAPVCKDDLVCLPKGLAKSLGQLPQLLLCSRITNSIRLLDPVSLHHADVPAEKYFREPFTPLCTIPELVEFLVLDIEPTGQSSTHGKFLTADAQVSPMNATSFGQADAVYHTRTHLGQLLQPGDVAMGYHLGNSNFNSDIFDSIPSERIPEVILVKKSYPDSKKRRKNRNWRLKSIAKEADDTTAEGGGRGALGRKGGLDGQRVEAAYEWFLRELEEDEELRAGVNLYRDKEAEERLRHKREAKARRRARKAVQDAGTDGDGDAEMGGDGDGGAADIDDGMTDDGMTTDGESEFGDDEDVPRIRMEELLDDMDGELRHILRVCVIARLVADSDSTLPLPPLRDEHRRRSRVDVRASITSLPAPRASPACLAAMYRSCIWIHVLVAAKPECLCEEAWHQRLAALMAARRDESLKGAKVLDLMSENVRNGRAHDKRDIRNITGVDQERRL